MPAPLTLFDALKPDTPQAVLDEMCEAAARYRGGPSQWLTLRTSLAELHARAVDLGAPGALLAQLAEAAAPIGSLWTATASADAARWQLIRWMHDQGPHPRPRAVFRSHGVSATRRPPQQTKEARIFLGQGSRWRRIQ